MNGRRFAAVLGLGPLPQAGAALVVRRVSEDGRIELAPADQTDLAVAQKEAQRASSELARCICDREECRQLLERCRGYLVGALAAPSGHTPGDTWRLYDDINAKLRDMS